MTAVRPKLKRIHSPDIFDLNAPLISERDPYCILIQAMFAPEGVDGEESFDILVCNSLWISEQSKKGLFLGRHYLIVDRFDINEIRSFLERIAQESVGSTWDEVAENLNRYAKWEFEDYVE